jgi:hypothetical protein
VSLSPPSLKLTGPWFQRVAITDCKKLKLWRYGGLEWPKFHTKVQEDQSTGSLV